ncbi:MAG: hypothetical protein ACR2QF_12920, partial [Geminicoccaceae bacterium]
PTPTVSPDWCPRRRGERKPLRINNARARDLAFAHTLARDLAFAHDRNRILALDRILFRNVMADYDQLYQIVGLLTDRERKTLKEKGIEITDELNLICVLAKIYLAAFLIRTVSFQVIAKWSNRQKKKFGVEDLSFDVNDLAEAEAIYKDALQQVQELQRRISRDSQPFEGIRIVRERKKEGTAALAA